MASDPVREEIFRLRAQDPPVSIRSIAAQLGVTPAKVQRVLKARARGGAGENGAEPSESAAGFRAGYELDPAMTELRRATERRGLELRNRRLEIEELELANRIRIMQRAEGGGDGGQITALLLSELRSMRDAIASRPTTQGPQSLMEVLSQYDSIGQLMSKFQQPRAPTSALDLEYATAQARMTLEDRRIARKEELEAEIRRTEVEATKVRAEAIASVIQSEGPGLLSALTTWLTKQNSGAAGAVAETSNAAVAQLATETPAREGLRVLSFGPAVRGYCPRCGAGEMELTPTGTDEDQCPACGLILAVEGGEIVSAGRTYVPPAAPTYAS